MGSPDYHSASHKKGGIPYDDKAQETDSSESGDSDEGLEPWGLATGELSTEEEGSGSEEEGGDPTPIAVINQIRLSSPMCYIQVGGGQKIKSLLDSGADVSVIQEKWARKLQYGNSLVKWDKTETRENVTTPRDRPWTPREPYI